MPFLVVDAGTVLRPSIEIPSPEVHPNWRAVAIVGGGGVCEGNFSGVHYNADSFSAVEQELRKVTCVLGTAGGTFIALCKVVAAARSFDELGAVMNDVEKVRRQLVQRD